jgi:hypothetical protein
VARPEDKPGGGQDAFVSRAADLEKSFVLAFQLNFAVIDPPRKKHRAVNAKKIPPRKASIPAGVKFGRLEASLYRHPNHLELS